jgi:hypothetical protein
MIHATPVEPSDLFRRISMCYEYDWMLPTETEETRRIKERADELTRHNAAPPKPAEPAREKEPVPA